MSWEEMWEIWVNKSCPPGIKCEIETRKEKMSKHAIRLRAIWAKYKASEYLESRERKKETDALWVGVQNSDRINIIKEAYGR